MANRYKNFKIAFSILLFLGVAVLLLSKVPWSKATILHPQGPIAQQELTLIITMVALMCLIVIPVFIATGFIAYHYRAGNKSAKYSPNWDHSLKTGVVLWGIPTIIIAVMAVMNWTSTHKLDPYRTIESQTKPITIQVVALRWKWLFIYPDQNIATVNVVKFPKSTPINFQLTADAPMSSFWIPQLGGQIYAMAGMNTTMNLMADEVGVFPGTAAEINGSGFAGMKFEAISTTQELFDDWVQTAKRTPKTLSLSEYNKLATPTENNPADEYSSVDKNLYTNVMMKYMMPSKGIE